jgi:hypothetical protein
MYKLGKKPYVKDRRDLLYKNYRETATLPPIPATFGHYNMIDPSTWGMLGNDTVGDCVVAGGAHETIMWTKEGSIQTAFTPANVLSDYSAITGYNPNNPNSDQGTEPRVSYLYRQKTGLIDAKGNRHQIGAFVALDYTNLQEVLEAMYLFSAVGVGLNFPDSAMRQFEQGQVWDVVQGSHVEGGHYVPVFGFDGTYLYCVTWGQVQKMTVKFFQTYCEEAWAILSQEMLNGKGLSPEGFNLAQLQADLTAVTNTPTPAQGPYEAQKIVIGIGATNMSVDGSSVTLDQPAVIDPKTSRTLLPLRALAQNMGYTVIWDATAQTITMTRNS